MVDKGDAREYVSSLPVGELPGVGTGALEKLKKNIFADTTDTITCRDIVATSVARLRTTLGPKAGTALLDACLGVDNREWVTRPPRRSVGAQVTWCGAFPLPTHRLRACAYGLILIFTISGACASTRRRRRCRLPRNWQPRFQPGPKNFASRGGASP